MNREYNNFLTEKCTVAILAGGKGTRLSERTGALPKPMVPICGEPLLQRLIVMCKKQGFCKIALLVHHRHEVISDFFGDGANFGVSLSYVIESEPRGTAGALRDALPILHDRFLVLYGDTFMDVDLQKIWRSHENSGAVGTLLLHPNDHPQDSDLVEINSNNFVRAILPYPRKRNHAVRNLVNAALYVLERNGLEDVTPKTGRADIAQDMFPRMLELGWQLHGYVTPEYIKDIGTPQRLDKVESDFISGVPQRLSNRHLRNAVFLDRDGTLIQEVGHLKSLNQIKLLPGTANAIQRLNRNGRLAVVVTNQPVIARGDISVNELGRIHARFESLLGANGAYIDQLYFCPHHPDKGFSGEVLELKVQCQCRKPMPGLINQACHELSINRCDSWMIGDMTSDIESGRRAGVRTILLRTGFAGADDKYSIRPDYVCPDLPDAVEWVLNGHSQMTRKMAEIAITVSNNKRLVLIGGLARSGKSFAAQVLKELLFALGRRAHIVSLDGWLKPKPQRSEGAGVYERYDMASASNVITSIFSSKTCEVLEERLYDRIAGVAGNLSIEHSISPEDIIIVEGVTALLNKELNCLPNTTKVFLEIEPIIRNKRLFKDYKWRGRDHEKYSISLANREIDEVPIVMQSSKLADIVINHRVK
jgi:histidinol-phosphate phosphatase family protein